MGQPQDPQHAQHSGHSTHSSLGCSPGPHQPGQLAKRKIPCVPCKLQLWDPPWRPRGASSGQLPGRFWAAAGDQLCACWLCQLLHSLSGASLSSCQGAHVFCMVNVKTSTLRPLVFPPDPGRLSFLLIHSDFVSVPVSVLVVVFSQWLWTQAIREASVPTGQIIWDNDVRIQAGQVNVPRIN